MINRTRTALAVALTITVIPQGVVAAELPQTSLQSTNPWVADWGTDSCVLARTFGDDAQPFWIRIEQFAPGSVFHLVLSGKTLEGAGTSANLSIQYGKGQSQELGPKAMNAVGEGGVPVLLFGDQRLVGQDESEAPTPAQEKAVTSITLTWDNRAIAIQTGPLDQPFAMLRRCTDDLVRSWGLDPAVQANLRSKPKLSAATQRAVTAHYPVGPLKRGELGRVTVRVMVDAKGNASQCVTPRNYSRAEFADAVCQAFGPRARFEPAIDANGNPVASVYVTTITFRV